LPFDVERLLAKLISKELKLARDNEKIKQDLASRYDCNYEQLYKFIDDWNYNYIDSANLKRFLYKAGHAANDSLLISIIRRFDLDADARLKQKEFIEGVKPTGDYSIRTTREKQTMNANSNNTRNN
jgi:Ca2+-binding EF-hand superfamily protein